MKESKIVKSQDHCTSIPVSRIIRTEVQHKSLDNWIVVAVVENDRAVTMARYPTDGEAIAADTSMWLSDGDIYCFPLCRGEA